MVAYLRIFKCGCTSLAAHIASLKNEDLKFPLWEPEREKIYFDIKTADETQLKDYFTFTFVRNPYDRFLSFYSNWIVDPPHFEVLNYYEPYGLKLNMPFEDCVNEIIKLDDLKRLEGHLTPQYQYLHRGYCPRVKYVGKLENLENDIRFIDKACGIKTNLLHKNKTEKMINPYTEETCRSIFRYYRMDFELFGYNPTIYNGLDLADLIFDDGGFFSRCDQADVLSRELYIKTKKIENIYTSKTFKVAQNLAKIKRIILHQ